MTVRKDLVVAWFLLTLPIATIGFIPFYLYTAHPIDRSLGTLLDETQIVGPEQVVVFNMTERKNQFGGYNLLHYCYYVSVKALFGNFTIYDSPEPVSEPEDIARVGLWYGKGSSQGREYEGCIVGNNYLILQFATANIFRIQVAFVEND